MENTTTLPVFDTTAPYHIKREYYRDGFSAFQKKFVMKRNYVMMALFFILLVSFVVSAVADPSNKTAYFLMMICLAAVFMLWYNPRKQRRMVLDAVQELEFEQFTACNDGRDPNPAGRGRNRADPRIPNPLGDCLCAGVRGILSGLRWKEDVLRAAEISTGAVRRSTAGAVSRGSVTVSRETWTASGDMSADTAQLVPEPLLQSNPSVSASHCQLPFQGSQIMQHCLMFHVKHKPIRQNTPKGKRRFCRRDRNIE